MISEEAPPPHRAPEHVQCPNCCRLAHVTGRGMGLVFYRCELCESIGAAPEPSPQPQEAGVDE